MSTTANGATPVPEEAAPTGGGLKSEFKIKRDGKDYVLYAGVLDLAHQRGLKGITTTLIQAPTELNGMTAICHATVEMEEGTFSGLGDASPTSVSRMLVPHLIRMAETRSKARALRDAVNVGVTALEELGGPDGGGDGQDEGPGSWPGRAPSAPDASAAPRPVRAAQDPAGPATQQQLEAITRLAGVARVQVRSEGMTFGKAADQITQLQKLQPKRGEG